MRRPLNWLVMVINFVFLFVGLTASGWQSKDAWNVFAGVERRGMDERPVLADGPRPSAIMEAQWTEFDALVLEDLLPPSIIADDAPPLVLNDAGLRPMAETLLLELGSDPVHFELDQFDSSLIDLPGSGQSYLRARDGIAWSAFSAMPAQAHGLF